MGWQERNVSAPGFVADWNSIDRNTGRQIDWSLVPETYLTGTSYTITVTEPADATDTALTVAALPVDLPVGSVLDFAGVGEFARLTAPASAGDTELAVEALDAAIEDNDTATVIVSGPGGLPNEKVIPAGTTMCELASGKIVPRAARPGAETAMGLLIATASQPGALGARSHAKSGHGLIVGGVIYENLLPEDISAYKTELATNGSGWVWQTYADNTEE